MALRVPRGSAIALAAACVMSAACGGSSTREEDGTNGGATTGGSSADGGSSGSAGTNGGMGGGGGAGTSDERLLPLEVGRRWTFQRSSPDASQAGGCQSPLETSVSGLVMRGADEGWDYHPACTSLIVQIFMKGDDIWGYLSTDPGNRFGYASPPVEEGAAWDAGGGIQYVWHDEGTVQVPAGTFERCWRRSSWPAEQSYIVLCRGVGVVIIQAPEENYRVELVGKNF